MPELLPLCRYMFTRSWDQEDGIVRIDGVKVWEKRFWARDHTGDNDCGFATAFADAELIIAHSSSTMKIEVTSTLNQASQSSCSINLQTVDLHTCLLVADLYFHLHGSKHSYLHLNTSALLCRREPMRASALSMSASCHSPPAAPEPGRFLRVACWTTKQPREKRHGKVCGHLMHA